MNHNVRHHLCKPVRFRRLLHRFLAYAMLSEGNVERKESVFLGQTFSGTAERIQNFAWKPEEAEVHEENPHVFWENMPSPRREAAGQSRNSWRCWQSQEKLVCKGCVDMSDM